MDSNRIKIIIVAAFATFVSLYLGISAATAQFEAIAWVIGTAVFITCLSLGRRIWLLIPFMTVLDIGLRIPGQPGSGLLGQILVIGFCIPLFLMKKLPYRLAWTELEIWIFIVTMFVVQVYLRNPTGVSLFSTSSVGGKPYAIFAICLVIGVLLGGLRVQPGELIWIIRLSILGGLLNLVVSILGVLVPSIGYFTGASYLQADPNAPGAAVDPGVSTRIGYLGVFGRNLSLWISTYVSPLRACLRPLWGCLIAIVLVAALMSGFRSTLISVILTFSVGIAYRSGFSGVSFAIFSAICGLGLLAAVNVISPLPPNIQRSLTILPGSWEERYRRDAENSSEWRFEIWREVLLTDRWIDNKWLGDGLGFKATELASQMRAHEGERKGTSGFDQHREAILKNGDYHSGPVQTIRTIGYVGLIFLIIALVRLAVHAHRQIQRCRNTEWFPLALFVGIPLIWFPFFFIFVFGAFSTGFTSLFLGYGMVRMLENNLPLPAYVIRRWTPYILRNRQSLPESALPSR